jgi:hypothetical protein
VYISCGSLSAGLTVVGLAGKPHVHCGKMQINCRQMVSEGAAVPEGTTVVQHREKQLMTLVEPQVETPSSVFHLPRRSGEATPAASRRSLIQIRINLHDLSLNLSRTV